MDYWNLDYFFNDVLDGSILYYRYFLDYLHFLYPVSIVGFLAYDLYLYNLFYRIVDLYNFLDYLRHLNYPFLVLDQRHYLFNDSIHGLVSNLYVILDLRSSDVLNSVDDFLDYLLNLNDSWNFDFNFNNFLYNSINWNWLFNGSLSRHDHFSDELDISILYLFNNDLLLNLDQFLYWHQPLYYFFDFNNFWNLSNNLNNLLNVFRNFYYPLNDFRNLYQFLHYKCLETRYLYWDIDCISYHLVFFHLYRCLAISVNLDYLWNLYYPLYYFLNDFLHLYYLRHNSIHF